MAGGALERGREAFAGRAWRQAFEHLSAADAESPLGTEDLERLAAAADLSGRDPEGADARARLYRSALDAGDHPRAARHAFWIGLSHMLRGDVAQGGGWLGRAGAALEQAGEECVERGYLLIPAGIGTVEGGDAEAALNLFEQALAIARRFGDTDLETMAGLGRGRSLLVLGKIHEGAAALDETMVAVLAGETSPRVAGIVYCGVVAGCRDCFDYRRATEWTTALTTWCESQPELVPFRGQCLVHRSQVFQMRGAWADAMAEARLAHERLSDPPGQPAIGEALYQMAELHRLRGDLTEAETLYRDANKWGRSPHPGLALLRLAQGKTEAAAAAIRREVDEASAMTKQAGLLGAQAEILLAAGDTAGARGAAEELARVANELDAPFLRAAAAHARGAVLLAEGETRAALDALRGACAAWQDLDAPYESARARALLADALRALGDADTADMELDAARSAFRELGAAPDLARLEEATERPGAMGGLTAREVEVLRLVAGGRTNRGIAEQLVISEKTVARHLSNIFTKLGVSTRAAATAYAYENGLV